MTDFLVYYDSDNDGIAELDISSDVVTDIVGEYGNFSPSAVDKLSEIGSVSFSLRNDSGAYDSIAFGRKVDIRVSDNSYTKHVFSGKIADVTIDSGEWGEQRVAITLEDWMRTANNTKVSDTLTVTQNVTADEALNILIEREPDFTDYDAGTENLPLVFSNISRGTSIYSEMDRVIKSELGYAYLRFRDNSYGETLKLENQLARGSLTPLTKIPVDNPGLLKIRSNGNTGFLKVRSNGNTSFLKLNQTEVPNLSLLQTDSEFKRGDYLVNRFTATDVSPVADETTVVLYTFTQPDPDFVIPYFQIGTGAIVKISGEFSNPNDRGTKITAKSVTTPVATTDYLFNASSDGTGTDLTANITLLRFSHSASKWEAEFKNNGATAYCVKFDVRGIGIYKDATSEYVIENTQSIEDIVGETREEFIRRDYSSNRNTSKLFADSVVALNRYPLNSMRSVSFISSNNTITKAFMFLDIGDKVRLTENKPLKDGKFYIRGIKFRLTLTGQIYFTWYLEEAVETICEPIAIKSPTDNTGTRRVAVDFGILPYLANLPEYSYSFWIKRTSPAHGPFGVIIGRSQDDGTGRDGNYLVINSEQFTFISHKDVGDGQWDTGNIITSVNEWEHVALTYDNTVDTANPVLWFNGVSQSLTETDTPSGASQDDSNCPLVLFNIGPDPAIPTQKYYYDVICHYALKDVRVYDRILTSGIVQEIYNGEDNYSTAPSGLLFQAIYAPSENISDYVGSTIEDDDYVLDVIHGVAGIPYNESITSSGIMLSGEAI